MNCPVSATKCGTVRASAGEFCSSWIVPESSTLYCLCGFVTSPFAFIEYFEQQCTCNFVCFLQSASYHVLFTSCIKLFLSSTY